MSWNPDSTIPNGGDLVAPGRSLFWRERCGDEPKQGSLEDMGRNRALMGTPQQEMSHFLQENSTAQATVRGWSIEDSAKGHGGRA